jgi:DNA-binding beta-propeller fold protein YncE
VEGPLLTQPQQIAYSETVDVVRNSRPRISLDGRAIYGTAPLNTTPALPPEAWAQTQNVVSAFDLEDGRSSLYPLPNGIFGRSAISKPYALLHAIGPDGDAAYLFDVDPASPAYRTIVATIPLPALSHGPVAGQTSVGTERRFGTITPAGDVAYVTQGGDGTISVIDTAAGAIASTIRTPTALAGGGYLAIVEKGQELSDHHAR